MVIRPSMNMSMLNKKIYIYFDYKKNKILHSYNCNNGDNNKFYYVIISSSPSKNVMLSLSVTI